jgi:hypothetical protein
VTFTVTIDCDNAAFGPAPDFEIVRILREIADRIDNRGIVLNQVDGVLDSNGNPAASFLLRDH